LAIPVAALAAIHTPRPSVAVRVAIARAGSPESSGPPGLRILSGSVHGGGDVFITLRVGGRYGSGGLEILSRTGKVLWFKAVRSGYTAANFRPQTLDGRTVLSYWVGRGFGGQGGGTDYVLNRDYQQIAAVKAGDGLPTSGLDFLITPQNTALVLTSKQTTADLTSIGGSAHQKVIDDIVQEINIRTGRVLWRWNAADHVPYRESEVPLPKSAASAWDWFYINGLNFGPNGTLLINARLAWTVYDVNRRTGDIEWQLGGKDSSFSLAAAPGQKLDDAGEIFANQHDPTYIGHHILTVFDNEGPAYSHARTVTIELDFATHTATLEKSSAQPAGRIAGLEGSAQTLPDGDQFVDWGTLPDISEYSAGGKLLFNARLTGGISYRGYLLPWSPRTVKSPSPS
jgi:Arylsulfotransferase (ASST)